MCIFMFYLYHCSEWLLIIYRETFSQLGSRTITSRLKGAMCPSSIWSRIPSLNSGIKWEMIARRLTLEELRTSTKCYECLSQNICTWTHRMRRGHEQLSQEQTGWSCDWDRFSWFYYFWIHFMFDCWSSSASCKLYYQKILTFTLGFSL